MNVRWTTTALADLHDIETYISRQSPRYAKAMVDRIFKRIETLTRFPELGSVVQEDVDGTTREIVEKPYRIFYRSHHVDLLVISIVHVLEIGLGSSMIRSPTTADYAGLQPERRALD